MALVNKDHSYFCRPHIYPLIKWMMPVVTPQLQSITTLWLVLLFCPTEGRRLSGWLETEVVYPPADGHPPQY